MKNPENELTEITEARQWALTLSRDQYGLQACVVINKIIQRMRWIPPGEFLMGSPEDEPGRWQDEGPQHTVRIHHGFWMFDTPVTKTLWQSVMGVDNNTSRFTNPFHPMAGVTWHDAQEFVARVNQTCPCLNLTLPSEAQWEYACRAGSETARYADDLDAIAWYKDNSSDTTHPVGLKQPNAWGLYDMLGNVLEWVQDTCHESYDVGDALRVMRGGSWDDGACDCRSAARYWVPPDFGWRDQGFRCARVQIREGDDKRIINAA